MTLTTAQAVRLRVQDYPRWFEVARVGDGTATLFDVPYTNLTSASAYVAPGGTAWSATGCTVNTSGVVEFSGIISANTAWRLRGVYSIFSDEEIGQFTADGVTVPGAALQAVYALQFDALKRAKWAAPDGTTFDDTAALSKLNDLYEQLRTELAESNIGEGGYAEWTFGQDNW
jgi:hypothetical protein